MGLAIDTFVASAVNPGSAGATPTVASGDTATVRNFPAGATAKLVQMLRAGASSGFIQAKSPLMHDNVFGIRFFDSTTPSNHLFPRETPQNLNAQDTLTLSIGGGTAETDLMALQVYYSNLPGANARLHSWGDLAALIVNVKPVLVAVTTNATAGTWTDTAITTSEDQLKANTDYAVLGYTLDTALGVVAIKGADTSNFRIGGPGYVTVEDTSDFFVRLSQELNLPCIPVINSANKGNTNVSTNHNAASVSSNIMLILAQLAQPVTP